MMLFVSIADPIKASRVGFGLRKRLWFDQELNDVTLP